MLAIISLLVLISTYLLVRQLNAAAGFTVDNRNHNAKVLNQAKQALIGYVAQQAALAGEAPAGEKNPGRLPCPEAPGNYGTANEGIAAGNCTLPAVGRLPWRTLGLDKLLDSASEPLWYVVSPGWALINSTATTLINSNSLGQLTVDGVANNSVALIIAPGPAFMVQAAAGCAARAQTHPTAGPLDLGNYLECGNATAGPNFVTTGPSTSFNDQVLRVTTADLLPGIEAAIANRIGREIVPALAGVYSSTLWASTISSANPLYPFAAPFANPGPGAGTSNYQGVIGTYQGLLPFNQIVCTPDASNPRCTPMLIDWWSTITPPTVYKASGEGYIEGSPTCTFQSGSTIADCQGVYHEDGSFTGTMRIEMSVTLKNVAMGLRKIIPDTPALWLSKMTVDARDNTCAPGCPWQPQAVVPQVPTKTLNPDGSMSFIFGATLPNIDVMGWVARAQFRLRFDRTGIFEDHALLDSTDPTTGWFVRNEWYRLLYYAVAPGFSPAGLTNYAPTYSSESGLLPPGLPTTPSCVDSASCILVANVSPNWKQRAILILAGRSLTNPAGRPNGTLVDYLEFGNADLDAAFEQRPVSKAISAPFNDRVVVLGANP